MTISITAIKSKISKLAGAEATVKRYLSELSRDILQQFLEKGDVSLVNLLLSDGTLSPNNRRIAKVFFVEFIYHHIDSKEDAFKFLGKKKMKAETEQDKKDFIVNFLSNPENNIFTWAKDNVEVERAKLSKEEKFQKMALNLLREKSAEELIELLFGLDNENLNQILKTINSKP